VLEVLQQRRHAGEGALALVGGEVRPLLLDAGRQRLGGDPAIEDVVEEGALLLELGVARRRTPRCRTRGLRRIGSAPDAGRLETPEGGDGEEERQETDARQPGAS